MPPLSKKLLKIGNTEFKRPNAIDRILDRLFLWSIPSYIKPNHLTIFRYLTVPIIFYFLLNSFYLPVLLLFLLSAFTDALDGALARTRDQITSWGKIHDPLADKLLIGIVGGYPDNRIYGN
ncbi:MAG: CDP-alcohol phosphatidyltransferase family protein [Patescibacteria group bacterium]